MKEKRNDDIKKILDIKLVGHKIQEGPPILFTALRVCDSVVQSN